MWGHFYAINERKVLALEFKEKSTKNLVETLSIIRRDHFLEYPIEMDANSTKLFIIEEPKCGFELLLNNINDHINKSR